MPVTRGDIPKHLTAGLRTVFFNEYDKPTYSGFEEITTEIGSTSDKETYGWLGSTAQMREWLDERMPKALRENSFSITNKKFEASLAVSKDALDDDQYGQIVIRVRQMAEAARNYYAERAFTILAAGNAATYGTCYDGQNFYSDTHSEGDSGTQDNLGSSALTSASLSAARTAMMRMKDDRGKPMGIIGDTLVVPPELEATALEIIGADRVERYTASGTDKMPDMNIHKGQYKVIVTPFITDIDSWHLLATKRVTRPLIFQNRMPTDFVALEGNSEAGFMRDEYLYGVKNRFEIGYGDWRLAYANVP